MTELGRQLWEAHAEVQEAKRGANERALEGILDPLVHFLQGPGLREYSGCLRLLAQLCTTSQIAVYVNTRRLVYTPTAQDCQLGEKLRQLCRTFSHLEHVILADNTEHVSLQGAPGSIRTLELQRRPQNTFPTRSLTVCPSLEVIKAPTGYYLESIHDLHTCLDLRELELPSVDSFSASSSLLPSIWSALCSCSRLQVLKLTYPKTLRAFNKDACCAMGRTTHLALRFCDSSVLTDISLLSCCSPLRELKIWMCPALPNEAFKALESCTGLHRLSLVRCPQLLALPDLKACANLGELSLSYCNNLREIADLACCPALRYLDINDCCSLPNEEFRALTSCTGLQKLTLMLCSQLRSLPNLQACTKLEGVDICVCKGLSNISNLACCPALRDLEINECPALPNEAFSPLMLCTGLQRLALKECWHLCAVPNLQACTNLEKVTLSTCENLCNMSLLDVCPALRELEIDTCDTLPNEAFEVLESCTGLQKLILCGCDQLHTLPNLKACTKLESVSINYSHNLSDISHLASCPALMELIIVDCGGLPIEAVKALESYTCLRRLVVHGRLLL